MLRSWESTALASKAQSVVQVIHNTLQFKFESESNALRKRLIVAEGKRAHRCYFDHQTSQTDIFQMGGRKGLEEMELFSPKKTNKNITHYKNTRMS